jgi:hypothetical protein
MRFHINTDPTALARFNAFQSAGDYRGAAIFLRKAGAMIPPSHLVYAELEHHARLAKADPRAAELFRVRHLDKIAEAKEAKEAITDMAAGGSGELRSEVIAELVKRTDIPAVERVDQLRAMGADREAELVRARHPLEVGHARIAAGAAEREAKAKAEVRERSIVERVGPRARAALASSDAQHDLELNTIRSRYRDKDGVVHETAAGYRVEKSALDARFNEAWSSTTAELRRTAEAELGAPPAQPTAAE